MGGWGGEGGAYSVALRTTVFVQTATCEEQDVQPKQLVKMRALPSSAARFVLVGIPMVDSCAQGLIYS